MDSKKLLIKLYSLTVFRALLADPVIKALCLYLESLSKGDAAISVDRYSSFVSALYNTKDCALSEYLQGIINDDENIYIRTVGAGESVPNKISDSVKRELSVLQEIASLTPKELYSPISEHTLLPEFEFKASDIAAEYYHRCENISRYGYGIYSRYHMFYLNEEGNIVPVQSPDSTRLSQLVDYKKEQQIILDNTKALLEGKPAANILLTGDAGTGKSSTIKAVVNELYKNGLRILEIRKEQLRKIPAIIDELSINPLKFILFIDDLSFVKDDDNFSALKAILEGSVSAKSSNIAIYATSNRRHLVKEKFSDREGDDIHATDTMQELISLSERFGIHITFNRPDKNTYLKIVHHLAEENSIDISESELDARAERFALGRGNRSARAAKQFIDSLLSAE